VDVVDRGRQVLVVADDPGGESVAEEVAPTAVAQVEALRVPTVEHAHRGRERLPVAGADQMDVISHLAPRAELPAEALGDAVEQAAVGVAVLVVAEDRAAVDAARGDVVDAFGGKHVPRQPGHLPTVES